MLNRSALEFGNDHVRTRTRHEAIRMKGVAASIYSTVRVWRFIYN